MLCVYILGGDCASFFVRLLVRFRAFLFMVVVLVAATPSMGYTQESHLAGVQALYDEALALFNKKKYKAAIEAFDRLESLYPFSQAAIDGSLMSAAANYEIKNYNEAAALAEGYVGVFPNSDVVDYAYYVSLISKYMLIPDLGLDVTEANAVLKLARDFESMFPDSKYLGEVREKLAAVRHHLAAREFSIGKFYLRRGRYIASIKRFSGLLDEYSDTVFATESVRRLAEAYKAIGDVETAALYTERLHRQGGADKLAGAEPVPAVDDDKARS